jgi:L-rhamnose 1-dehydrogenase
LSESLPNTNTTKKPNSREYHHQDAITGGTTGIGRAIALEYIRQGCNVAINHLNLPSDSHHKESLITEAATIREKDPKAGRLIEVEGDVTKPETGKILVEEAVKEFGRLDIFVSNAGVCQFAEFLE